MKTMPHQNPFTLSLVACGSGPEWMSISFVLFK